MKHHLAILFIKGSENMGGDVCCSCSPSGLQYPSLGDSYVLKCMLQGLATSKKDLGLENLRTIFMEGLPHKLGEIRFFQRNDSHSASKSCSVLAFSLDRGNSNCGMLILHETPSSDCMISEMAFSSSWMDE